MTDKRSVKKVEETEKMTAVEFGEFLKFMRDSLGYSQVSMATRLGYNKNLYNSYENGVRLPRKWKEIEVLIRELVKKEAKMHRENGKFSTLTEDAKESILALHLDGKNTVQIGMQVEMDELDVEKYLISIGESPKLFMPCFSGNTSEYGTAMGDEDVEDFEDLFLSDDEDGLLDSFAGIDDLYVDESLAALPIDDKIGGLI